MRLNRRLLGAGDASALVALAVQKLRILRISDLRGWKTSNFAPRKMERKGQTRKSTKAVASALISRYLFAQPLDFDFSAGFGSGILQAIRDPQLDYQ